MEFIESVDINHLKFITSLSKKDLNNILNNGGISKKERKNVLHKISNYCKKMISCGGECTHLYKYTLNKATGRLYCGTSIQLLPKAIRGFLFKNATDYDMKNAHPTMLLYLCKKHEIPAENLNYYVNNREDVLADGNPDEIKKIILKSINNENRIRSVNGFLKTLDLEIKKIQKQITKIDEYTELVNSVPQNKTYNVTGSAMSRILCDFENQLLQTMISTTNSNGLQIIAPMFDGLLISGENDITEQLESALNEKYPDLNMKIHIKPQDNSIVYDESKIVENQGFDEIVQYMKDNNLLNYEDKKYEFELEHSKIIDISVFFKEINENGDKSFKTFNESNMKVSYKHLKYYFPKQDNSGQWSVKQAEFINKWLKDEDIRCYKNVDLISPPDVCPDNILNLWTPFAFANSKYDNYVDKPQELKFILNHIKILCDNDEKVADYFIKWVGQMLQYPAIKTVCPTLISKEGSGKGTFLKLLSRIMGGKKIFETTNPCRDVWGSFNNMMTNCFLVNLNELSKKETIEADGKIKGLITDKALTINSKGQNAICVNSNHRFLISTNKDEPINTTKDDRRNIIIRCSDELIDNTEYFEKFNKLIEDDDVVKTVYEYFMGIAGLREFNRIPRPVTEYQENLKMLSKSVIELFLEDLVFSNFDEYEVELSTKELFDQFKVFVKNNQYNYDCSYQKFTCRLYRIKMKGISNIRNARGTNKVFQIQELKKSLNLVHGDVEKVPNNEIVSTNKFSFL